MYLPSTKEIILELKEVKDKQNLSVPCIQRMCELSGDYIAINTFRNVFAKGSENDSFSYERTLRPIHNALLGSDTPEEVEAEQLRLLTDQLRSEREESKKRIEYLNRRIKAYQEKVEEQEKLIKELLEEIK